MTARKKKLQITVATVFGTVIMAAIVVFAGVVIYDQYFREWDQPTHFYLDGYTYVHHGRDVDALPQGCEMAGRTKNVGNENTGYDLEGNVEGYVYIDPQNPSVAYFWLYEWDEAVDGPQAYLVMERDTPQEAA